MADSLTDQANRAALAQVQTEKPSQFTVGGSWDGTKLTGGVTYDRRLANGWGATAYLRAWWDDLPVSTTTRTPKVSAGGEVTKRF